MLLGLFQLQDEKNIADFSSLNTIAKNSKIISVIHTIIDCIEIEHITPFNSKQDFIFSRFNKEDLICLRFQFLS